jgi:hypothetical protein
MVITHHYAVQGAGGTPSRTPPDAAPLEEAINAKVGHPGTTWVAACDGQPVAGRMASGEPWAVNCPECQKTVAWTSAPDDGPHKKRGPLATT